MRGNNTGASKPRGSRYDEDFARRAEQATRDAVNKQGAPQRSGR